ncbi:RHS repeat-associated core domain-containing protein, partial [Bacteroides acidifaciens]|uniref:RHS repeat-associated core domain-containing protein n=1 Tax=Bacteroides acidifaciens TaxID=85831 RepID=UPI0026DEBBAC
DDVLGMYYAKARFYSADDKRFVAMDPIKGNISKPLSIVSYLYCMDNPLRYVDLLGQSTIEALNAYARQLASSGMLDDPVRGMTTLSLKMLASAGIYKGLHNIAQTIFAARLIRSGKYINFSGKKSPESNRDLTIEYQFWNEEKLTYEYADIVAYDRAFPDAMRIFEVKPAWHLAVEGMRNEAMEQLKGYVKLAGCFRNGVVGVYHATAGDPIYTDTEMKNMLHLQNRVVIYDDSSVTYRMYLEYDSGLIGYQVTREDKKRDKERKEVKISTKQAQAELQPIAVRYAQGLETDLRAEMEKRTTRAVIAMNVYLGAVAIGAPLLIYATGEIMAMSSVSAATAAAAATEGAKVAVITEATQAVGNLANDLYVYAENKIATATTAPNGGIIDSAINLGNQVVTVIVEYANNIYEAITLSAK